MLTQQHCRGVAADTVTAAAPRDCFPPNIFRRRSVSPKCDRHPEPPTIGGEGISLQKENDLLSFLFISLVHDNFSSGRKCKVFRR